MDAMMRLFGSPKESPQKGTPNIRLAKQTITDHTNTREKEFYEASHDLAKKKQEFAMCSDPVRKKMIYVSIKKLEAKVDILQKAVLALSKSGSTIDKVDLSMTLRDVGSTVSTLTKTMLPDMYVVL